MTLDERCVELRFQEGLDRLRTIVRDLEAGDLELEDQLARFEEGLELYKKLCGVLAAAEKRVEVLVGERAGKLQWEPFQGRCDGDEGEDHKGPERGSGE